MGNIADTSIFQEMQEEMEDWFEYMDNEIFLAGGTAEHTELIHEINGEVVTEPLEDVLPPDDPPNISEKISPKISLNASAAP